MSNTIVYQHNTIPTDDKNRFCPYNRLVKYNSQVLSIGTTYNYTNEPNYLVIENLDTNQEIRIQLNDCCKHVSSHGIKAFMYSDSILWIGFPGNEKPQDPNIDDWREQPKPDQHVLIFNLDNLTYYCIQSAWPIDYIEPIGQKLFAIKPHKVDFDPDVLINMDYGIYKWSDLLNLDKPIQPVRMIKWTMDLYPVDWSSSSIAHLADCAWIQTQDESYQIELFNEKFESVGSFDVRDIFTNYKPLPPINLKKISKFQKEFITDTNYPTKQIISVNDNCLLLFEYRDLIEGYNGKISVKSGLTNVHCWDFTANTPVKFSRYNLNHFVGDVIPFRDSINANAIKYIGYEWYPAGSWCRIYQSKNK